MPGECRQARTDDVGGQGRKVLSISLGCDRILEASACRFAAKLLQPEPDFKHHRNTSHPGLCGAASREASMTRQV